MGFKCYLPSRSLIQITGNVAHEFLQGLYTNDIRLLSPGKSIWGCFLNHAGRVICDAHLYQSYKTNNNNNKEEVNILIDVHSDSLNTLQEHLLDMRMRKKIEIKDISKEFGVMASLESVNNNNNNINKETISSSDTSNIINNSETFLDPRSFALPSPITKIIFPKTSETIINNTNASSSTLYDEFLYTSGIGEGPDIIKPFKTLPFEANIDFLKGVSFHKGCYLGQELTHRTHVMLITRKRTVPLQLISSLSLETNNNNNKIRKVEKGEGLFVEDQKVGEVLAISGNVGLALLRLRYVDINTRNIPRLQLKDAFPVNISIPNWWEEKEVKKMLSQQ